MNMNIKNNTIVEQENQTFVIDIKCRENYTWQGTVTWVQKQEMMPFRSMLELIHLIDSAVNLSTIEAQKKYYSSKLKNKTLRQRV